MKSLTAGILAAFVLIVFLSGRSYAQTFAPSPNPAASQAAQLQELTKKIEEQNAKIDMLSQQILKLEQQLSNQRPGVIIGDASASAPATSTSTSSASTAVGTESPKAGNENSHVVARGETLTSIAKMYNTSITELQKFNHIDNPLKLQAGQTLLIPPSPIPSPSSSGQ